MNTSQILHSSITPNPLHRLSFISNKLILYIEKFPNEFETYNESTMFNVWTFFFLWLEMEAGFEGTEKLYI